MVIGAGDLVSIPGPVKSDAVLPAKLLAAAAMFFGTVAQAPSHKNGSRHAALSLHASRNTASVSRFDFKEEK